MDPQVHRGQHKIRTDLTDALLHIQMDVFQGQKLIRKFMTVLDDASLPLDVKNNFGNIENVKSILDSQKDCAVDEVEGKITLHFSVVFPNGSKSTLTGILQLVEQQITQQQLEVSKNSSAISKEEFEEIKSQLKSLKEHFEAREEVYQQKLASFKQQMGKLQQAENKEGGLESRPKTVLMLEDRIRDLSDRMQQQKSYFADIIAELKDSNKQLRGAVKSSDELIRQLRQENKLFKSTLNVLALNREESQSNFVDSKRRMGEICEEITNIKSDLEFVKKKSSEKSLSMENSQQLSPNKPVAHKSPMEFDMRSPYLKQFINNGKYIVYNGSEESTQLLGKVEIRKNPISFLTVCKTNMNQIGFGVIDAAYIKERNSVRQPNYIMYYGWNGGVYEAGECLNTQGTGFKCNETVKMIVDLHSTTVRWEVGGIVEAKHQCARLSDHSIEWVPFVRMCNPGDSIKWYIQA